MPTIRIESGSIKSNADTSNVATVEYADVTQTSATTAVWKVYLKGVPWKANYVRNESLTLNTRGTHNPNADNALVVTSVGGPGYYICNGNWPVNA